jgi:hypothetical protein
MVGVGVVAGVSAGAVSEDLSLIMARLKESENGGEEG